MPSVTYKNQPGIDKTKGNIPLAGNAHVYTVKKILWPKEIEEFLQSQLVGETLHVCSGHSKLGDMRLDLHTNVLPDILGDAARLPFCNDAFDTLLIDPPYNGKFQWLHNMISELGRVARQRIIFQHWYLITDKEGRFKKKHAFKLTDVYVWQPKTYFGRANVISVLDKLI